MDSAFGIGGGDTYVASINCSNCGNVISLSVPVGTTVKVFLKGKKCANCKQALSSLKPDEKKPGQEENKGEE